MVDAPVNPSVVFPLPGYTGPIQPHGAPENIGGSDIFAPAGSTILNMISGKVSFVSTQATAPGTGGNAVEITGVDGREYYYAHMLNPPNLKVGQSVTAGQQLGQVDNTGNAATTQAHLHIGIGQTITEGKGPKAGIGTGFNAVALLQNLQKNPTTNNVDLASGGVSTPLPPINFVPSVPGFTQAHLSDIQTNLDAALAAGIDPFVWLAIVAHESNFVDGVINPKSGACGYAQLYPCDGSTPKTGAANAQTGLDKLIAFLKQCNGDLTCALDNHYSGGMPGYAALIKQWADAIEQANPELAQAIKDGTYKGGQGTGSVTVGPGSSGSGSGDTSNVPCPPIQIPVGPTTVYFPDVGCMFTSGVKQLVQSLTDWWKQWQTEHIPTWTFVIMGVVLILVGVAVIANQSGVADKVGSSAIKVAAPEAAGMTSLEKATAVP